MLQHQHHEQHKTYRARYGPKQCTRLCSPASSLTMGYGCCKSSFLKKKASGCGDGGARRIASSHGLHGAPVFISTHRIVSALCACVTRRWSTKRSATAFARQSSSPSTPGSNTPSMLKFSRGYRERESRMIRRNSGAGKVYGSKGTSNTFAPATPPQNPSFTSLPALAL